MRANSFRDVLSKRIFGKINKPEKFSKSCLSAMGAVSEEAFQKVVGPAGASSAKFISNLNESDARYDENLGFKFRMDYSAEELKLAGEEVLKEAKARDKELESTKMEDATIAKLLFPSIVQETEESVFISALHLISESSTSKDVRDQATELKKKFSEMGVEREMNMEHFKRFKALSERKEDEDENLMTYEKKRMMDRVMRDYRRAGLDEDEDTRKKLTEIKKKMSELSIEFSKNLGEENTTLYMKKEELKGLPETFFPDRKQEDGTYKVTLKYPDSIPIMRYCQVAETRVKLKTLLDSKCAKENGPIMEQLVELRAQQAKLLGYDSHADFVLEVRMAKNHKAVNDFLVDLKEKLEPKLQEDLKALKGYKEEEEGKDSGDFGMADYAYYMRLREEKEFSVDHEELKKYFQLTKVINGAFDIYQRILGLEFTKLEDAAWASWKWQEDVELYRVTDKKSKEIVGHFFLDLYPREGKYGHAAVFTIQQGCHLYDGTKKIGTQKPVCAMLCNFEKPNETNNGLTKHGQVVTFFHEFGHVMHVLCGGENELLRFAGTRVERDFVEAPSQMLENWCWRADSLKLMSEHYETGKPIPDEMLKKLCASEFANAGLFNRRQLCFGMMDQYIHTQDKIDSKKVWEKFSKEVMGIPAIAGTDFLGTFGHLAGGYDSAYYGYMWSKVYSSDMFHSKFLETDALLKENSAGMQYRKEILSVGATRDGMDSLKAFLGREPRVEPFLTDLGLEASLEI